MCVSRNHRSLTEKDFDAIYDYIEQKTNLCKFVNDVNFRRAMISRDGQLRNRCKEHSSFSEIWGIVQEVVQGPNWKEVSEEIIDETVPGGGFQTLLTERGLCKTVPRRQWTVAAKCNLLYHLGILALDIAALKGELR